MNGPRKEWSRFWCWGPGATSQNVYTCTIEMNVILQFIMFRFRDIETKQEHGNWRFTAKPESVTKKVQLNYARDYCMCDLTVVSHLHPQRPSRNAIFESFIGLNVCPWLYHYKRYSRELFCPSSMAVDTFNESSYVYPEWSQKLKIIHNQEGGHTFKLSYP